MSDLSTSAHSCMKRGVQLSGESIRDSPRTRRNPPLTPSTATAHPRPSDLVLHPGRRAVGTAVANPVAAAVAADADHAALPLRLSVIRPSSSLRNEARWRQRRPPATPGLRGRRGCRRRGLRRSRLRLWRVVGARGPRWRECRRRRVRLWLHTRCIPLLQLHTWLHTRVCRSLLWLHTRCIPLLQLHTLLHTRVCRSLLWLHTRCIPLLRLHSRGLLYASQPREGMCQACALGIERDALPPCPVPAASTSGSHEFGNEETPVAPPTLAPISPGASTARHGGSLGALRSRGRAVGGARRERGRDNLARGSGHRLRERHRVPRAWGRAGRLCRGQVVFVMRRSRLSHVTCSCCSSPTAGTASRPVTVGRACLVLLIPRRLARGRVRCRRRWARHCLADERGERVCNR